MIYKAIKINSLKFILNVGMLFAFTEVSLISLNIFFGGLSMKKLTALFLAMFLLTGVSLQAVAQQQQQQGAQQGMQQQEVDMNFSDADLEKFVEVQPALEEIREDFTQRLEAADDQEAANQLQQEAGQLMVEAVEQEGLDVDTYNNIAMALQSNEELRERVDGMM